MKNTNTPLIIGVTMSFDPGVMVRPGIDYDYIRRDYGEALSSVGAQPIFLDSNIDPVVAATLCDGIVISGGMDIDPTLYGEEANGTREMEPRARIDWERTLIDACDEQQVPILGVCYGQQLLNVHYGGSLYQDLPSEKQSSIDHSHHGDRSQHIVTFIQDGLGYQAGESTPSASRHHQAIKELADGFTVVAIASDDVIEAIKGHGHYGIQWHPESDETAERVYGAFIEKCTTVAPVTMDDILAQTPQVQ